MSATSSFAEAPLHGEVALVTGAARNLGRVIACELARHGAAIAVNTRSNEAEADQVAAAIRRDGGEALAVVADVADEHETARMFEVIRAGLGPVSILVNNAAARSHAAFGELTLAEWSQALAVTLTGTFLCTRAALADMLTLGRGRIVMIAGEAPFIGHEGSAHVAAAKAGVLGMMRSLAREVGALGITVNAVSPGGVRIPGAQQSEEMLAQIVGASATKHPAGADEVAWACALLCSPQAGSITGQTIHLSGGLYLGW